MYYRKVIRITAEDSPNVKYALAQKAAGLEPTGEIWNEERQCFAPVTEGVLTWREYQYRRLTWDQHRQRVGLDAQFDESGNQYLWPQEWLDAAEARHRDLTVRQILRKPKALGCDSAEGGDDTSWAVVDEMGLVELVSMKTPNTSVIPSITIEMGERYGIDPVLWMFDRGGGGKQHVDRLRQMGYAVQSISFGESATRPPKPGQPKPTYQKKRGEREEKYAYANRRAQMYHELSLAFDPRPVYDEAGAARPVEVFGLPTGTPYDELRRQLSQIPKFARYGDKEWSMWDAEGKIRMLPKNRRSGAAGGENGIKELCLSDLLNCSPDEADSLALAYYGMRHGRERKEFWIK